MPSRGRAGNICQWPAVRAVLPRVSSRTLLFRRECCAVFSSRILDDATLFLMQSEQDAVRLLELGADPTRVVVTGNLKYDLAEPPDSPLSAWLVGGTGAAESQPRPDRRKCNGERGGPGLAGVCRCRADISGRLIDSRSEETGSVSDAAAEIVEKSGRETGAPQRHPASTGHGTPLFLDPGNVLLLDSLGELAGIYRLADAVFVGRWLARSQRRAHILLEPAAFGKVPVYGPSMENFRDMAAKFLEAGAGIEVRGAEDLGSTWRGLLVDTERAARMGTCARELVNRNRGATARVLAHIEQIIDQDEFENARSGLPQMARQLLRPLSVLYSIAARIRVWCYSAGIFKGRREYREQSSA